MCLTGPCSDMRPAFPSHKSSLLFFCFLCVSTAPCLSACLPHTQAVCPSDLTHSRALGRWTSGNPLWQNCALVALSYLQTAFCVAIFRPRFHKLTNKKKNCSKCNCKLFWKWCCRTITLWVLHKLISL